MFQVELFGQATILSRQDIEIASNDRTSVRRFDVRRAYYPRVARLDGMWRFSIAAKADISVVLPARPESSVSDAGGAMDLWINPASMWGSGAAH